MLISDNVIKTYQRICELSTHNENILAVLNSLIGNEEETVCLLHTILTYLTTDNSKMYELFLTDTMLRYFNEVMKPQLQKVINSNADFKDRLMNNGTFNQ